MSKSEQEIVADLRKADMSGAQVDAGHLADQVELAFTELEDKWQQRVSEVEKIISLARDEYTVHECRECTYRKCCDLNSNGFGSAECLSRRVSISLMLGIEDSCFTKLLDDIEAAWRREKAEIEVNALAVGGIVESARHSPCNAAAIRDALESVRNWCINKLGGASFQVAVEGLLQIVDKAMTAPARNCDRFADETDAQIAFLNEVWLISVTKETALEQDRFENWTDEMRSSYAKWLFAPAAERKGGGAE